MYLKEGKDGYQMLLNCEALIDEEEGPLLFAIVENHFANVEMIASHAQLPTSHRPSLVPQYVKNGLIKDLMVNDVESEKNFSNSEK